MDLLSLLALQGADVALTACDQDLFGGGEGFYGAAQVKIPFLSVNLGGGGNPVHGGFHLFVKGERAVLQAVVGHLTPVGRQGIAVKDFAKRRSLQGKVTGEEHGGVFIL